ncbi:MAG: SDR family NAD(P)-dependent oxidoreductase [Malacoplasma sp.]|nr:SDR family NAD(P)-dependent oxidoreductase [Malacoplasma sp.]
MSNKKVAIITGASQGIGYAIGKLLAQNNYIVYSLSRNSKQDEYIIFLKTDITDCEQVKSAFNIIFQKHNHIDLVINNSGYAIASSYEELDIATYQNLIKVNDFAVLNVCLIALEFLKLSKGKIINIGSLTSYLFTPFGTFYATSKQLLKTISYALYNKYLKLGISICCLIVPKMKTKFDDSRVVNLPSDSVYSPYVTRCVKKVAKSAQKGMDPIKVANLVLNLDKKPTLKPQKIIGLKTKILCFLTYLIPANIVCKLLFKVFCKQD